MTLPRGARLLTAALLAHAGLALAQQERPLPDDLEPAAVVHDGDAPIAVPVGHPHPLVIDWDRDGKRDLLVGQFGQGKLRLYLNQGADDAPSFAGYQYVRAVGEEVTVPVG